MHTAEHADRPPLDPRDAFAQLGELSFEHTSLDTMLQRIADLAKQVIPGVAEASVSIRTTTYPALVHALRAVRAAAPDAEVAVLGYPWILPTSGGCFDRMPIAEGDVPYLRSIQATLNDVVRRAAAATGATYVNMNKVSDGHDACRPIGVRWVEPVLQGTNAVVVHPNALGEQQMAAQAMTALDLR